MLRLRSEDPTWIRIGRYDRAERRALWVRLGKDSIELCSGREGDDDYAKLTVDDLGHRAFANLWDTLDRAVFAIVDLPQIGEGAHAPWDEEEGGYIRGLEEAMRIAERERDDLYRSRDTRGMQQITAHGADVVVRALEAAVRVAEAERGRR